MSKHPKNIFSELKKTYLIAEIGVNHNGDLNLAKLMIDEAKKAGADAVKFQSFTADTLVLKETPKVLYQQLNTPHSESHYEMIKKLELDHKSISILFEYCKSLEVDFISTPYDIESAKFLNSLDIFCFKTASADLVDLPLQNYIASTKKPCIIATGMASLGEIERVNNIYESSSNSSFIFLHCVSNYPCSDASLNLLAMQTIQSAFNNPVGFSDHSEGFIAAVLAVGMGAKVIEKHFTLNKNLPGPDHKASSTPEEFLDLVINIRRAETMLGSHRKFCQPEEYQMAKISRKSLVVAKSMKKGDILTQDDLILMRPGDGLLPDYADLIIGRKLRHNVNKLHKILLSDLDF
jgi:N,N'-diacetyllegionaminate synthase